MDAEQEGTNTVLLVDDNRIDAKLIQLCLEQSGLSISICLCSTTNEALQYIEECCSASTDNQTILPALVLLDLNLPGHGGHTVLQQIRAKPELQFVPVVIFSTSSYEEDIVSCYAAGANSYITKPADFHLFRTTLTRTMIYWLDTNVCAPQQKVDLQLLQ